MQRSRLSFNGRLIKNITHHSIETAPESESGKLFGSTIKENIIPLPDVFRYVVPLMHCIMGLGNQVYNELNRVVKELDEKENGIENKAYKANIESTLSENFVEKEEKKIYMPITTLPEWLL